VHAADFELALADQHLVKLGQTLLAFVALKLSPKFKVLVNHFESLRVVPRQLDFLPELARQMCAFNRLHVQIADTLFLEHCCVPGVGQRAGVATAEASQIVLVSAEGLSDGSSGELW